MGSMSFKKATAIQFSSKYMAVAVQLILSMVLARILTPEEYGVVDIISVFLAFFSMLSSLGIAPAIVQYKDLKEDDLGSLFSFSIVLGLLLSIVFVALSYVLVFVYGNDLLFSLGSFSALSVFFGAVNMVPNGVLLRDKRFGVIGLRTIVTTAVGGLLAIILAINNFGSYAIVANTVISSFLVFAWNCVSSKMVPGSLRKSKESLKRIWKFSSNQFGFSFVNYFSRNLDNMLIGKFFGSESLAYYQKAYKLTTYPVGFIPGTLAPVLQPYLSDSQDNHALLYSYYLKITKILGIIGVYVSIIFFTCSNEIVLIMFGNQWMDSIPLFRALSVSLAIQIIGNITGAILQSANRTDYEFRLGIINTCITLIFLFIGLLSGSVFITAWSISIAFCCHIIPIIYYVVYKTLCHNVLSFVKEFVPEIASAFVIGVIYCVFSNYLPEEVWSSLIIKILSCSILYAIILLAFGEQRHFAFLRHTKR